MAYSKQFGFPIHGNCVNFRGGLCTLSGVAVDPDGAACPSFTPKSLTPIPQIGYGYPATYTRPAQTGYGYRPRYSSGPNFSALTAPRQGGASVLFMSSGRRGRGGGRGGGGRGRMGGFAAGPGGSCVCPRCGYSTSHVIGTPCYQQTCPKCGSRMTRGG